MKNLKVALASACAVVGWAFTASADIPASAYVQSGLVAQWDGIENAGAGQHSNSPTVWKDLKGSSDLAIVNPITVGANCMTISRGSTTGYFTGKSAAFLQALKPKFQAAG